MKKISLIQILVCVGFALSAQTLTKVKFIRMNGEAESKYVMGAIDKDVKKDDILYYIKDGYGNHYRIFIPNGKVVDPSNYDVQRTRVDSLVIDLCAFTEETEEKSAVCHSSHGVIVRIAFFIAIMVITAIIIGLVLFHDELLK